MSPIDRLTPNQKARFPEFRCRWLSIGLSTEPADRPRAEAAILEMYRHGGLPPPQKIVWCGSPLSQGVTRAIVLEKSKSSVRDSVGDSVGANVGASVWDSVGASVGASVWASVWDSVRDSVGDSVGASVRASVWDSVGASVRDSVGASVGDSVRANVGASVGDSVRASVWASVWASVGASVWDSVGASVWDSVYGSHDAGWLSFYDFFRQVVGLEIETEKLAGLFELSQSAGWAIPHQNICWVSERHSLLARDERGRLHSVGGPAVAYPDGWKIYAVHGVRVPEDIIESPKSITVQSIESEKNAEIRRVMVDRYGHGRYLKDSGAQLVNQSKHGKLWRKDQPGDEPIVMVEVINSTPEPDGSSKTYFLRVPPDIETAARAVAWTFGIIDSKQYRPKVET